MKKGNIETSDDSKFVVSNDDSSLHVNNIDFSSYVSSPKKIDFSKVKTLEDVIHILEAIDMTIYDHKDARYDRIRHLLKDVD